MKATGIVRRVDDLGRILIPKEIRSILKIEEGDKLEIFLEDDRIMYRKYKDPNAPLTLDELREMDGEPVWIVHTDYTPFGKEYWGIVRDGFSGLLKCFVATRHGDIRLLYREYGKTWLAYRRKPEEG